MKNTSSLVSLVALFLLIGSSAQACGLGNSQKVTFKGPGLLDVGSLLKVNSSCSGRKLHAVLFQAKGDGLVKLQINGNDANVGSIIQTDEKYTYSVYPFGVSNVLGDSIETLELKVDGDVEITSIQATEAK